MKRILITGANSYIGTNVERWLMREPDKYQVDTLDMIDGSWREKAFSGYDVVFHVAAIVHVHEKKKDLYYQVNRDLAVEVAKKAKSEKVLQFVFLSTMGVYGLEEGEITDKTSPNPKTHYAKAKYAAELQLSELSDEVFHVAILRPPLVYGPGCKGNYIRLSRFARKSPLIPKVDNQRSMIYIDNLSEFIRWIISFDASGLYFPQNSNYVNTTEALCLIANSNGKQRTILNYVSIPIHIIRIFLPVFRKVFGSCTYDMKMPGGPKSFNDGFSYETCSFSDSIMYSEKGYSI